MEESKRNYKNIQNIAGNKKERTSFTQVDILNATDPSKTITLTMKHNIKHAIMNRNQHHASQSLQTPCTTIQGLANAIDPNNNNSCIEQILHGSFIDGLPNDNGYRNFNRNFSPTLTHTYPPIALNHSLNDKKSNTYLPTFITMETQCTNNAREGQRKVHQTFTNHTTMRQLEVHSQYNMGLMANQKCNAQ